MKNNTENLNKKIVSGCESLAGKALTIDHDARTYHIGDRVIPFSSCVIKEGKIYYLTPMCKVLVDMGFKGVAALIQLFVLVLIIVIAILKLQDL